MQTMPWINGQSGNPTGRPKAGKAVSELARKHTVRSINRLARLVSRGAEASAVQAAQVLLAYGWGRPVQRDELSGPNGGPLALDLSALMLSLRGRRELKQAESVSVPLVENAQPAATVINDLSKPANNLNKASVDAEPLKP